MIKKLAGCIREYKKDTIISPLFMALEVAFDVIIPLLMAKLIDNGIEKGDMSYIFKMGTALLLSAAVAMFFGVMGARTASRASAGFAKNVRHDMFYNVQNFSFENIDKFSTASIITRLTTDVTRVQQAFQMIIRIAVRCPLNMLFSMIMAFAINPEISLIFLAAVPILGIFLLTLTKVVHPIFTRTFKIYDKLNNVVQENLHGIRVVKSFVREDQQIGKFKGISNSIYKNFMKAETILAFNMPVMQFVINGCTLLISWLGAKLIVGGSMTTGALTSLLSYTMQILSSLMMLSMIYVMLTMAKTSAERMTELLDEQSSLTNCDDPVFDVKDSSVRFENVSFSYSNDKERLSLKNINLDIKPGETIGIIGGTGSAKSTLVQLIPRLYDVTEGCVKVGGVDVRKYDIETLRNQVAMVLQKNELFSGTISDNLRWGNPDATDEQIKHACELAQADSFVESFPDKYDTMIEQGGTNVSGGQKQRLCIARALLKKPKILILDDSTSAVDTVTDASIRKAFREEIPDTTKFIIAQRINSVKDADRIIVMEEGEVHGFGTHEELLASNEIYRQVYETQMQGVIEE